jgi:hypothetical protein
MGGFPDKVVSFILLRSEICVFRASFLTISWSAMSATKLEWRVISNEKIVYLFLELSLVTRHSLLQFSCGHAALWFLA